MKIKDDDKTILNLMNKNIYGLLNIKIFLNDYNNLKSVNIQSNRVENIIGLPEQIKLFNYINNLPESLVIIDCRFNKITYVNKLPSELKTLYICRLNNICEIKEKYPKLKIM